MGGKGPDKVIPNGCFAGDTADRGEGRKYREKEMIVEIFRGKDWF